MMPRPVRFAIAGLVMVIDRITKYWVEQSLSAFDTITVIPGVFNLVHAQNRGAAFGILNEAEGFLRSFVLIGVSGAILVYLAHQLFTLPASTWPAGMLTPTALALVLGGACGNLFDRIWRGSVTDFLQVFIGSYEWPSFNVADSAITVGAILLIFSMWRAGRAASERSA
jgi:signal peptidase II